MSIRPELLKILACPTCKSNVELFNKHLECASCGGKFLIEQGIPIMLANNLSDDLRLTILGLKMAERGSKVFGLDTSVEGIKIAKQVFEKEEKEGLFVCGDLLNPPFKNGQFDFIYGGGMIEHFEMWAAGVWDRPLSESKFL